MCIGGPLEWIEGRLVNIERILEMYSKGQCRRHSKIETWAIRRSMGSHVGGGTVERDSLSDVPQ